MRELERKLKALANRRRLAIVAFLKRSKKACVGDIAKEISLSFKSTSRHLAVLSAAEILDKEQVGLSVMYELKLPFRQPVKQIVDMC